METYNKLKSVPQKMLKPIQAGRLKGMSDIKPQWRIEKLTEVFGLCGIGWKFTIVNKWIEDAEVKEEKVAFVDLELFVKVNEVWSEAIPANGGSMFVTKEKNGPYVSDEAYKMATTDALGTAAKHIGLAADIYMGHGGKYEPTPQELALITAVDEVKNITDLEDLKKIWTKYPQFQAEKEFINVVNSKKTKLTPKTK